MKIHRTVFSEYVPYGGSRAARIRVALGAHNSKPRFYSYNRCEDLAYARFNRHKDRLPYGMVDVHREAVRMFWRDAEMPAAPRGLRCGVGQKPGFVWMAA